MDEKYEIENENLLTPDQLVPFLESLRVHLDKSVAEINRDMGLSGAAWRKWITLKRAPYTPIQNFVEYMERLGVTVELKITVPDNK